MHPFYKIPKPLKTAAIDRLADLFLHTCIALEKDSQMAELVSSQVASSRHFLSRLPPTVYQAAFDKAMVRFRERNVTGYFLELLVLPTLTSFRFEATNTDLIKIICVSEVLKDMRGLETFTVKILTSIPDESLDLVLAGITQGFERMKSLVKVDLVGFDLPIGGITFLLSSNCCSTLKEFSYQDLESQGKSIDGSFLKSLSGCKKLKVLDFKGVPVTASCLEAVFAFPDLEYLGMSFDDPELILKFLKDHPDVKFTLKRLLLTDSMKQEAKAWSVAFPNAESFTLIALQKQDLKWLQVFKKLRHLSVDFKAPTPAQVFEALLRKSGKKLRTLRIRFAVGLDWTLLSDVCPSLRTICFEHCGFASLPESSIQVLSASHSSTSSQKSQASVSSSADHRQIFFKNLTQLWWINPEGREMPKMLKSVLEGSKKLEKLVVAFAWNDKSIGEVLPKRTRETAESISINYLKIDSYVLTVAGVRVLLERLPRVQQIFCRGSFQNNDIGDLRKNLANSSLKEFDFVKNTGGGFSQETADFLGHSGF